MVTRCWLILPLFFFFDRYFDTASLCNLNHWYHTSLPPILVLTWIMIPLCINHFFIAYPKISKKFFSIYLLSPLFSLWMSKEKMLEFPLLYLVLFETKTAPWCFPYVSYLFNICFSTSNTSQHISIGYVCLNICQIPKKNRPLFQTLKKFSLAIISLDKIQGNVALHLGLIHPNLTKPKIHDIKLTTTNTFRPSIMPGPRNDFEEVRLALSKLDLKTSFNPNLEIVKQTLWTIHKP